MQEYMIEPVHRSITNLWLQDFKDNATQHNTTRQLKINELSWILWCFVTSTDAVTPGIFLNANKCKEKNVVPTKWILFLLCT